MPYIPFRAKNPPESFPYVTIGLIVLNSLVYLATADYDIFGLTVRHSCVEALALNHEHFTIWRLFTSLFLQQNILVAASNMLFLWVFGAAVEGRLRWPKYLAVYLLSGVCGGLLNEFVVGIVHPGQYSLGAMGAIMGVAGCYVYMFPYTPICMLRLTYYVWRIGVVEWHAWCIVLYYIALNLISSLLLRGTGGAANFAQIGGFGIGLLAMLALRPRRDNQYYAQAQATRADARDYNLMGFMELEILMEHPRDDNALIMTFCEKGLMEPSQRAQNLAITSLNQYARLLVDQADPARLASLMLRVPKESRAIPSVFYLRLASRLEQRYANELALHIYWRICETDPHAQDSERAFFRLGYIMETAYRDTEQAIGAYEEVLNLFPHGALAFDARQALARLRRGLAPAGGPPANSSSGGGQPQGGAGTRVDYLEPRN